MRLEGLKIGAAVTGSFCTLKAALKMIEGLVGEGADVAPIVSRAVAETDTRFTKAEDFKRQLVGLTGHEPIETISGAEPIGPKKLLDALIVSPCTGNTLAKIAAGVTDTPVTMAVKAHLRNDRPVIIGVSTNDGLGANAKNIGALLNVRNVYFIPFYQDDAAQKPRSIIADNELAVETVLAALDGRQIQPILLGAK